MDDFSNKQLNEEPEKNPDDSANDEKYSPVNHIHPKISPVTAGIIGLLGGFFLYQIVGGLLTLLVFGFDYQHAPVNSVRLMTMASQVLFILLPALIFSKWVYEDVTTIIRFHLPKIEEILLFSLGIVVLTPLLQYYLSLQTYFIKILAANSSMVHSVKQLLDKLNDMVDKTYGNLLTAHSVLDGIIIILIVSVIPAICEETMFRGFIQRSFEFKFKSFWAAAITAMFFALYHFNPYGLIPLFGLGLYFGFAAYISDSIFVPVTLHFINNFAAVILYFIYGDDDIINSSVDKNFDLRSSVVIFIILSVVFASVIYLIKKYYSKRKIV